ncbi:hypothetical protein KKE18_00965 [Patescibacteria group bacterium]|nr:hypothetical protein [Patescibacteria group bacterium]MBU0922797.1 hypothetical protein [Patescibacteria group bacterium]MBU1844421.1 hypothetical protein [Patescibacteria group bacterium]
MSNKSNLFKEGLIRGIGWAFGVTIGFVIISTILVIILRSLGGLPVIGDWIASVVEATLSQLAKRTPVFPQ